MRDLVLLLCLILMLGCTHDEKTVESGYDDGYSEGYSTQCRKNATMIGGHWDSDEYKKGYDIGSIDGIQACLNDKKNNNLK